MTRSFIDKLPKWFWKLPMVWRLKYDFYHEQFLPPAPPKPEKTLPYVAYDKMVIDSGSFYVNPFQGGHFRCPYCGQAHELKFTYEAEDLRLKQSKTLDIVWLERIRNGVTERFNEDDNMFIYYVAPLANMITIPCHQCHLSAPKWRWTHAYQNPLLYFQMESLCHCGGEMYYQGIPGSDRFGLVCDKCNWVKPGEVISGSEGD